MTDRIRGVVRPLALLVTLAMLLVAFAAPAAAVVPGNNGTVKVHDSPGEPDPIIKNEPHVDCPFHLHFFFADADQTGSWWILEWAPGDKGAPTGVSGTYTTDLSGQFSTGPLVLPAGHYKVFWQGDEEKLIKHKVFWVDTDCVQAAPTPPVGEPGGNQAAQLPETSMSVAPMSADGWRVIIAGLAGLIAAAFVLSPVFPRLVRRIKR